MDDNAFSALIQRLEGLKWFIFSGLAVKIYADSDREVGDIDIVVAEKDLEEFAERLDAEVQDRDMLKQGNRVNDLGFVTEFEGIEVEVSSGFPQKRLEEQKIDKLFKKSNDAKFLGEDVNLVPVEELVVHKAKMSRDKDFNDLKLLNDQDFDKDFLLEVISDWGIDSSEIIPVLKQQGFCFD